MSKHTPGPWTTGMAAFEKLPRSQFYVAFEPQKGLTYEEAVQQYDANARLIAAAPDLVEALERLMKVAWRIGHHPTCSIGGTLLCSCGAEGAYEAARAALAKATQETK